MSIKRAVSLYSYQHEYFQRTMDLEACIKAVSDLGATGVEIIPEQMMNEFPNLSDSFLDKWFGWMKKYNVEPTCYDAFLDTMLYKNRVLSDDECVEMMERDLRLASQLGCFVIRTLCTTPVRIIERSLPLAQKYNVKIGLEIHAPLRMDSRWFEPYAKLIEREGHEWFGIIPDMGVFEHKVSRIHKARAIRDGANPEIVEYTAAAYNAGQPIGKIIENAEKMGLNQFDHQWLRRLGFIVNTNPKELINHKDYIFHIHAKFYDMLPDNTDDSLNYEGVISVLKEIGYEGYLSSEYEGNRTIEDAFEVDSVTQVRRQHEMFKKLLA